MKNLGMILVVLLYAIVGCQKKPSEISNQVDLSDLQKALIGKWKYVGYKIPSGDFFPTESQYLLEYNADSVLTYFNDNGSILSTTKYSWNKDVLLVDLRCFDLSFYGNRMEQRSNAKCQSFVTQISVYERKE